MPAISSQQEPGFETQPCPTDHTAQQPWEKMDLANRPPLLSVAAGSSSHA